VLTFLPVFRAIFSELIPDFQSVARIHETHVSVVVAPCVAANVGGCTIAFPGPLVLPLIMFSPPEVFLERCAVRGVEQPDGSALVGYALAS